MPREIGQVTGAGHGGASAAFAARCSYVAEAGALPGFENAIWWSFLTTAGTPAPIVNKLASELQAILSLDDVKTWFVNAGGEVDYLGPAELGRFIQKEIAKFKQIAKEANVKQE
jgi:tripartite-type tricarboxylate transporter receptor subunit TctC